MSENFYCNPPLTISGSSHLMRSKQHSKILQLVKTNNLLTVPNQADKKLSFKSGCYDTIKTHIFSKMLYAGKGWQRSSLYKVASSFDLC